MEDQDILILEEPMNGLDKRGVAEVRKILLELNAEGKTMILMSYNQSDVAMLCDAVNEMDQGEMTKIMQNI